MKRELSESIKVELIQILNHNIKLEEAKQKNGSPIIDSDSLEPVKKENNDEDGSMQSGGDTVSTEQKPGTNNTTQTGLGGPGQEKEAPKHSFKDILLGNQPSTTPWGGELGLGDVAAMAAGGKAVGTLGQMFGGKLAQKMTNLLGGGQGSKLVGGALGDVVGKIASDTEALSGAKTMQAQIGDIVPQQLALRWEGSGTPGWFRQLVPKYKLDNTEPKSGAEQEEARADARTAAREKRIRDIELSNKEAKYGLPPI